MAYKTIQTQTLAVAKTDSIKRGFVKHFVGFHSEEGQSHSGGTAERVRRQTIQFQKGDERTRGSLRLLVCGEGRAQSCSEGKGREGRCAMKSKVAQLLERYGYQEEEKPSEYNVRYWRSDRYELPVSVINGIWECCDDAKVQRGTGSKIGLRRLELAILRTERRHTPRR